MAARYWVGGTASWNATPGTKWATTSGGAGGAAVPTSGDDVFFDAASTGVCTMTAGCVCRSLNATGFTGTLSHPVAMTLTIGDATAGAGNVALLLDAGMTYAATSQSMAMSFVSTSTTVQTIATAGKTLGSITINGSGSRYQLADGLTILTAATLSLNVGELDTNSQTCNWGILGSNVSTTRTLILGASVITMTQAGTVWNMANTTGLTFNAGTSHIICVGSGAQVAGAVTYYDVSFTGPGTPQVNNSPTFHDLTRTGTAVKTDVLAFTGNATVTGTFTVAGNSSINRLFVRSSVTGTQRTITAAAVVASNVDFQDIAAAGAASWDLSASTGGSGDALGNTGITFTTAAPQAWQPTTGGLWSDASKWTSRVPLPQDDVTISKAFSGGGAVNPDMPRLGRSIDWTGTTGSPGWANSPAAAFALYGSLTLAPGMGTINVGASQVQLMGRGNHTVTWSTPTFLSLPTIDAPGGTYTFQDAFVGVFGPILLAGTLDVNNFNVTINSSNNYLFQSTGAGVATLKMGSSTWTLTGQGFTTIWNVTNTNLTILPGTSEIVLGAMTTAVASRTFAGGGKNYHTLTWTAAPSNALIITGQNTFDTLNIGPGRTVTLPSSLTTNVTNWNVEGTVYGYQRIPGITGNTVSAPDSAPLSITGDLDLRCRVALDVWVPPAVQVVLMGNVSGNTGYEMWVSNGFGRIGLLWGNGSATVQAQSTVSPTVANGAVKWVRATLDVDDGAGHYVAKFYTSDATDPGPADWTQLGTTVTGGTTTSIADTSAVFTVGSRLSVSLPAVGNYYRAQVRNNILDDGTGIVLDADFTTKPVNANTFTESSSNAATVTITGDVAQAGDGRVLLRSSTAGTQAVLARPFEDDAGNRIRVWGTNTVVFDTDRVQLPATSLHYLWTPDTPDLSPPGDLDLRVKVALTDWTPTAEQVLIAKHQFNDQRSFWLSVLPTSGALRFRVSNIVTNWADPFSHTAGTPLGTGIADGTAKWVRVTFVKATQVIKFWLSDDGTTWTQLGDATGSGYAAGTAIADSTSQIEVGSYGAGTTSKMVGYVYRAQMRNNVLDDGTGIALDLDAAQRFEQTSDYLTVTDIKAGGAATWDAGTNSTLTNSPGWEVGGGAVTVALTQASVAATATLALTAPTQVPLSSASATSAATLALTAQPLLSLPSSITAAGALAITAPSLLTLPSSVAATGALGLTAPTGLALPASAVAVGAAALTAAPSIALSSVVTAAGALALSASALVALGASAALTAALRFAASRYAAVLFARAGLRGYWPLSETGGVTGRDLAGASAQDATYSGGVTLAQTGIVEDGTSTARFDGSNGQAATAGAASELDVADTLTIVIWLARERTGPEHLSHKGTSSIGVRFDSQDRIEVSKVGEGVIARSTISITDTDEHMILVAKAGASTLVAIDGVDVTETVQNRTLVASTAPLVMAGA